MRGILYITLNLPVVMLPLQVLESKILHLILKFEITYFKINLIEFR